MALQLTMSVPYDEGGDYCPIDARVDILAGLMGGSGHIGSNYDRGGNAVDLSGASLFGWPIGEGPGHRSKRLAQAGAPTDWDYGGALNAGDFALGYDGISSVMVGAGHLLCVQIAGTQPRGGYVVYNDADVAVAMPAAPTNQRLVAICVGVKDRDVTGTATTVQFFTVSGADTATPTVGPDISAAAAAAAYTHVGLVGVAHQYAGGILYVDDLWAEEAFGDGIAFHLVFSSANVTATTARTVTQAAWRDYCATVYTADISNAVLVEVRPRRNCWARFDFTCAMASAADLLIMPRFTVGTPIMWIDLPVVAGNVTVIPNVSTEPAPYVTGSIIARLAAGTDYTVAPHIASRVTGTYSQSDVSSGTQMPGGQILLVGYPIGEDAETLGVV